MYPKYSKLLAGSGFSVGTCYNKDKIAIDKEQAKKNCGGME